MSNAVKKFRQEKDAFFKGHPQSPIPEHERASFTGLSYYPYDAALDLQLQVKRFDDPQEIEMLTSTGEMRPFLRYGELTFEVEGQAVSLVLYFSPGSGHYFLPFMDATSGDETYGAGRYLDPEQVIGDTFHIDFNLAYHPFCAYSPNYSCPIPPEENRLPVSLRVGEKLP